MDLEILWLSRSKPGVCRFSFGGLSLFKHRSTGSVVLIYGSLDPFTTLKAVFLDSAIMYRLRGVHTSLLLISVIMAQYAAAASRVTATRVMSTHATSEHLSDAAACRKVSLPCLCWAGCVPADSDRVIQCTWCFYVTGEVHHIQCLIEPRQGRAAPSRAAEQ